MTLVLEVLAAWLVVGVLTVIALNAVKYAVTSASRR